MKTYLANFWNYIMTHLWAKDIFRANILFITLVIIYDLFHFSLQPIHWGLFLRMLILLNICQFFKALLDRFRI